MSASANLLVRIAADITGFDRATTTAMNRIKALANDLQSIGTRLTVGVSLPIAGFAAAALKATGDIEALKLGLNSITRSAAETERQFTALREVAKLPGLGLEEAVRGATNLQALGFSFEKSRAILLNFGNALASVGRGRDDLEEVIRQLGQLGARGQVTADNLRPIIERVPQVAESIKRNFGPNALGNPAETFKKLGVSSEQFIEVLTRELGKIPQVTGGLKNTLENVFDSLKISFAEMGKVAQPLATKIIDQFIVPTITRVTDLAREFQKLPESVQSAFVAITGFATAAPIALVALGTGTRAILDIATAFEKLSKVLAGAAILDAILAIKIAFGAEFIGPLTRSQTAILGIGSAIRSAFPPVAIAAGIYAFSEGLSRLVPETSKMDDGLRRATQGVIVFNKAGGETGFAVRQVAKGTGDAYEAVLKYAQGVKGEATPAVKNLGEEAKRTAEHLKKIKFEDTSEQNALIVAGVKLREEAIQSLRRLKAEFEFKGGQQTVFDVAIPEQAVSSVTDSLKALDDASKSTIVIQEALREALVSVPASMFDYARAMDQVALAAAKGRQAFDMRGMEEMSKKTNAELKKAEKTAKEFGRQVSLITNDVARNITDLIFKGGKFKDVMVDALESIAKALVRLAIEKTLTAIAGKLTGLLGSIPVLGKALGGLFSGTAASVATSAAGQAAGSAAGSVAGSAAGSAIGGVAGSAASSAAGIGGQAAGQAAGLGVSAIAGIVTGAISAVSGVIGNFQMAGMNKSLDLIEKATRYSEAHLLHILEKINLYLPELANIHARLMTVVGQGVGIYNAPGDGGLRLASGGGMVNITINGAQDPKAVAQEVYRILRLQGAT